MVSRLCTDGGAALRAGDRDRQMTPILAPLSTRRYTGGPWKTEASHEGRTQANSIGEWASAM